MSLRVTRTAQSNAAVNKIKKITKREIHDINLGIPKEFLQKREYMQSDEFLKDPHNQKMFALSDMLMKLRDSIAENIKKFNDANGDELIQGINGYTRIKRYLTKDNSLNFSERENFSAIAPYDSEYGLIKKYFIKNVSKEAKIGLGM